MGAVVQWVKPLGMPAFHMEVPTASLPPTSSTTRSHGLCGPGARPAHTATWACCKVFSCSGPTQNQQLFRSWINETVTNPNEKYVASESRLNSSGIVSLFVGGPRGNKCVLYLRIFQHVPTPLTPRNPTEVRVI